MKFKTGDKVAYSAAFCKSIGAFTGEIPAMRGEVISTKNLAGKVLVKVRWADGEESSALSSNLAKVGPNTRFCNCD